MDDDMYHVAPVAYRSAYDVNFIARIISKNQPIGEAVD
jgi:hypothetical protein